MFKPTLGKLNSSFQGLGSMRPAGLPLAVEFGVGSLKILQLTQGDTPAIASAVQLDTPDDLLDNPAKRLSFQIDALPKLLKQGKFKTNRAVCAVPSGQMVCKHVQIVPSDELPIEKLAAAQIGAQLGCDPSALLVRCRVIEGAKVNGKKEVICFAAARDFVARLMSALKSAKLEPVGIHNEYAADLRAIDAIAQPGAACSEADGAPTLVLDLGVGTTKAVVAHGSKMVFARSIELGTRHMDEAIAHQLRCTMQEARATRLGLERLTPKPAPVAVAPDGGNAPGVPAPVRPARAVGPEPDLTEPLEILVDEASMCLRYHRMLFPDRPVEKVIFLGGESRQRLVCEHLARSLRLAAQSVDPLARLARSGKVPCEGVDVTAPQPGWAVAVGMCLSPTDL
jgi:Tfp pilus assembly PilM family ATPase